MVTGVGACTFIVTATSTTSFETLQGIPVGDQAMIEATARLEVVRQGARTIQTAYGKDTAGQPSSAKEGTASLGGFGYVPRGDRKDTGRMLSETTNEVPGS